MQRLLKQPEMKNSINFDYLRPAVNLIPKEKRPDPEIYINYHKYAYLQNPTLKSWNGYQFNPGFEPDTAQFAYEKWEPRGNDVIVATYPKAGTTWTRELLRQIIFLTDEKNLRNSKYFNHFYAYLEAGPVSKYQVMDNIPLPRRVLGTHLPAELINFEKLRLKRTKLVYVIPNPKDQAASWYPFVRSDFFMHHEFFQKRYPENKKIFLDMHINGNNTQFAKEGEGYLEHIRSWHQHKDDENVLFLCFEEMKKDLQKQVRRLADFIDVSLTDDDVKKVCENSSIEKMKKSWDSSEMPTTSFFRKGWSSWRLEKPFNSRPIRKN
ncbi:amine sulfotransferase-like isoform X2 [Clavelina lepadiformis]|uniref:amine sulfotransferase-like isoform X2 n=2 Tax=Clavelina lepadiformis TaxID=159417 RepID=UPI0040415333